MQNCKNKNYSGNRRKSMIEWFSMKAVYTRSISLRSEFAKAKQLIAERMLFQRITATECRKVKGGNFASTHFASMVSRITFRRNALLNTQLVGEKSPNPLMKLLRSKNADTEVGKYRDRTGATI